MLKTYAVRQRLIIPLCCAFFLGGCDDTEKSAEDTVEQARRVCNKYCAAEDKSMTGYLIELNKVKCFCGR